MYLLPVGMLTRATLLATAPLDITMHNAMKKLLEHFMLYKNKVSTLERYNSRYE